MSWQPKIRNNKQLINLCLEQIESETGFHITEKQTGDTYFVFTGEANSICEFHIKEIPGFRFALWTADRFTNLKEQLEKGETLWTDYIGVPTNTKLVFFTQFERDLDKFKPSRSGFVIGITQNSWIKQITKKEILEDGGYFYLNGVTEALEFMKKHPIKAYCYVGWCDHNIWNEISGIQALKEYIRDARYVRKSNKKKQKKLNKAIKLSKKLVKQLTQFNYYILKEDGCYPSIQVNIRRKDNIEIFKYTSELNIIEQYNSNSYDIWLNIWEVYLDQQTTKAKEKEDKDLQKRFNKRIQDIENNKLDNDEHLITYKFN